MAWTLLQLGRIDDAEAVLKQLASPSAAEEDGLRCHYIRYRAALHRKDFDQGEEGMGGGRANAAVTLCSFSPAVEALKMLSTSATTLLTLRTGLLSLAFYDASREGARFVAGRALKV